MSLLVSALVELVLGIFDRILPSIAATMRAKRAEKKLAENDSKIDAAIERVRKK